MEAVKNEVLKYLFEAYQDKPDSINGINEIAQKYGVDVVQLSDELFNDGLIRDRIIQPKNIVGCTITLTGIEEIDSTYYNSTIMDIIEGLGERGGNGNVMEILELPIEKCTIGLQFAKEMISQGLLKNLHAAFPGNFIGVELTDNGWKIYNDRPNFGS